MARIYDLRVKQEGDRAENGLDDVGCARAREAVDQSSEGRADHGGELPERRTPGDRIRICLAWNYLGTERGTRGLEKASSESARPDDGIDRPHSACKKHIGANGDHQERSSANRLNSDGHHREGLSVEAVGDVTRIECGGDEGQRLGEPNDPQRQRVPGQSVYLPGNYRCLDL